ncbi:hypothetical protein A3K79_02535 [Candidatus Bathyarchaeota archaeon RBG_13_46_16b]|nr:MAG: hypothetical protein A3K79_02535 [Candidatus Bathyarchaeota archaeon RBG_13_46_16b]
MLLIAFIMPSIAVVSPPQTVKAQPETLLKVQPQDNTFYTNTTPVGHTFIISIIAENIPTDNGMYGWEFVLHWTPGMINCTTETINYGLWSAFLGPWIPVPIDNVNGEYHQSLTARSPAVALSGTFWLVNLTFTITQAPPTGGILTTSLALTKAPGYALYCLVNAAADEIPHGLVDGLYQYISPRPPVEEAKVEVTPPAVMDPSLVPSSTFDINITATKTSWLHGFILSLSYNATVIECIDLQEGNLLQSFGPTTIFFTTDNILGEIYGSLNLTDPNAEANGNGTLIELTFHVKDTGESPLDIHDTQLYDRLLAPLPHTTKDGYFNNVLMPILYVDPPLIIDPSMMPGDEFQVDIRVANVSNLYDFEFTLLYDTNVLNGLGIVTYPFGNATSFDLEFQLNDTEGLIWVRVQYYPPAEPLTTLDPVTLVKIFFQIQSYGATPLDLTDTSLSDYFGGQITHIAQDGFVSVLQRDVAIVDISTAQTEIYKGWTIKINVTAANLGDIAETFNVTLFISGHNVGMQTVTGLAPNDTTVLQFSVSTSPAWFEPCHNYTLAAEASQVPYEIDITNNYLEDGYVHIRLMGDINGDKYVNAQDAILLGLAFGSRPGSPNWNPAADLNQDTYINAKDVVLLGMNFGAYCGP